MQVYNLTTYPHLIGLFEELGVDTEPSEMSFSLSLDGGALEWASHGLHTIFAQRGNLLKPSFYRMIWDVVSFGRLAPKVDLAPARTAHLPGPAAACALLTQHTSLMTPWWFGSTLAGVMGSMTRRRTRANSHASDVHAGAAGEQ